MTKKGHIIFLVVTLFIDDQTYKINGKTRRRVLLRNSYRVKGKVRHDTIANLSKCSDKEIEAIKWALKNKKNIPNISKFCKTVITRQGLCVGSVWLLYKLSERYGIAKALGNTREGKLSLLMVIASLIGHNSRLSIVRLAQRHAFCDILGLDSFTEDDLYNAMDWLSENQEEIEDKLFQFRYKQYKPTLYLYDVTSSYLEGVKNELAAFGYNRDKKNGKMQIVIGLLTDEDGYPISVQVFEGNTTDNLTFRDQIEKVKNRFSISKVVIVGDRGMIKSAQIEALNGEENFNFITAITKPQIETLIKNETIQLGMFDEQLVDIQDNDIRYILRRNPIRKEEIKQTRKDKLQKLTELLNKKNQYLKDSSRARVNTAINHLDKKSEKLKIDKWINIANEDRFLKIEIKKNKLQEISKFDGCYVIKTDLSKNEASKEIVHSRYKDLAKVEWAFRTMKSKFLEMRGIFVRKEKRTRAHVFNVMLGYMLYFNLYRYWEKEEIEVEEGIDELSSLCSTIVNYNGITECQTIPQPRELGALLLKKAKVVLPDVIPSRNVNVATRKKLVPERKISKYG